MPFCLWLGSSSRVTMPCSSSVFSRSARMFDEMPSSDRVSSSRKCRRLPNIMSRTTKRLHRSPTTSSVRLIGQPERMSSAIAGFQKTREKKPLAISHQFWHSATSCKMQAVGESAMARLIMWNLMTLDGFVEGPGRDISWHLDVWGDELEKLSIEQGKSAGGLMFGRVTY